MYRFVKILTLRRINNLFINYLSLITTKIIKKPVVWGLPYSFSVEPANLCNLKCPECPTGLRILTRPTGYMNLNNFRKIIDQIAPYSFYLQLFFQGEPYIHKDVTDMIDYAHSKNMYVSVSTNGLLINEKNIERIIKSAPDKMIYSLDGIDEKSYQSYRVGGTFSNADSSLRLIIKKKKELKKKTPFVEIRFLVNKQNEHQIQKAKEYAKEVEANRIYFKSMQIINEKDYNYFIPSNNFYSRYKIKNEQVVLNGNFKNQCNRLWLTSVITWDGIVVPCCFDKNADYKFGNILFNNIDSIIKGKESLDFRKKLLLNRKQFDMCSNCTEGLHTNILS